MPQSRTPLTSFRSRFPHSELPVIQDICQAITINTDVLSDSWRENVESAVFTSIGNAISLSGRSILYNDPRPWSKFILGSIQSSGCDLKSDIERYRSDKQRSSLTKKNSIGATLERTFGRPTRAESNEHMFNSQVVSNILRHELSQGRNGVAIESEGGGEKTGELPTQLSNVGTPTIVLFYMADDRTINGEFSVPDTSNALYVLQPGVFVRFDDSGTHYSLRTKRATPRKA